jgi:Holliday junction resolvase RusA-like endonuclease
VPPLKKPDADNILKIITDPLSGLLWRDDCQIIDAHVNKVYSDAAHVSVRICVNTGPRFEVCEE